MVPTIKRLKTENNMLNLCILTLHFTFTFSDKKTRTSSQFWNSEILLKQVIEVNDQSLKQNATGE